MAKPLVTRKKAAWQKQFKRNVLVGKPLGPNAGVTARYERELAGLINELTQGALKIADSVYAEYNTQGQNYSMDASPLGSLKALFLRLAGKKVDGMIRRMLMGADKSSAASLHSSLKELSGGLVIKTNVMTPDLQKSLQESVADNARLIKRLTDDQFNKIEKAVMHSVTKGNGLADLVGEIQKIGDMSERRARRIAHDQTRKATNACNQERMKSAGITHFKWLHSGASKVPRSHHKNVLNGQVFRFDDPPIIDPATGARGLPGDLINCKCRMVPVVKFDEE